MLQFIRFVLKQADNLKKKIGGDTFNASWAPIKAFLSKNYATNLLNKLFMSQAFHNSIDFATDF